MLLKRRGVTGSLGGSSVVWFGREFKASASTEMSSSQLALRSSMWFMNIQMSVMLKSSSFTIICGQHFVVYRKRMPIKWHMPGKNREANCGLPSVRKVSGGPYKEIQSL